MKKRIFLLHCFPVPYRNHLFKALADEAERRGYYFEVHFFDKWDESRPAWRFESKDLDYPHKFWKPLFKKGPVLHFNPDMLRYIHQQKPNLIISGGVWSSINSMLTITFSRRTVIGWDETNRFDFGSVKRNYSLLKKFLIKRLNYFAIPGKESWYYYQEMLPDRAFKRKVFFSLPNLVDEKLFTQDLNRQQLKTEIGAKLGFSVEDKLVYWPARFIEDKGIENFIQFLTPKTLEGWKVILVGDGPLKESVLQSIKTSGVEEFFILQGLLPYKEAIKFYYVADMLIMPSLSDSNPLSLIEAIHCSLPLLVSNRVGNIHEVLQEKLNGMSVDPFDEVSMRSGITEMFSKNQSALKDMGHYSKLLAEKHYTTEKVIKNFFESIEQKGIL